MNMDLEIIERRFTRSTLSEISLQSLRSSPFMLAVDTRANIARNSISPTASPEEMLIQQRGRRKMPVTWSPDIDLNKRQGPPLATNKDRTPVKTPVKSSIVLRSTPRKRLLLNEPQSSPDKTPKKPRSEKQSASSSTQNNNITPPPLQTALKGLSHEQLVLIIEKMVAEHPELEKDVLGSLPQPDLKPLEEKLIYLKGNIFKSLPKSRLTSKTDSPAFSRASTHVNSFKKTVIDQGKLLVESQHWESVLDYVLMAWRYVRDTPLWDNPPHNAARKQCFQALSSMVLQALRKGTWTRTQLEKTLARFEACERETQDVDSSLRQILLLCNTKLE